MPAKTFQFNIVSRWDISEVLFTAELDASLKTESYGIQLGAAVNLALKAGADLTRANLAGAYLADAYLAGAYLAGAYLAGANLTRADLAGAYLADANLTRADLAGAYLADANLAGANLTRADLAGAYLADANLAGANLTRADLTGAYLAGAKGVHAARCTSLLMLLDQPGKIRAYKMVSADGKSPIQTSNRITYEVGQTYEVKDADTNPQEHCGAGINVADSVWVCANWSKGNRIFVVEFEAKDIACIPLATDGKFRCHRVTVVAEKSPADFGLDLPVKEEAA